jgi:large subunit ribosomal protein L3
MCRKIGMTQVFNEAGDGDPRHRARRQPNRVVQKKTPERDGYSALQLGYGERDRAAREQGAAGALREGERARSGSCARAGFPRGAREVRGRGREIAVDIFSAGQRVDVIGTSKGKGYQGVVRRHGFAIKKRTHGYPRSLPPRRSIGPGSYRAA